MNNYQKLKKLISKYDIISFDIFDTLIKRNCLKPSDIFKITELVYINKFNKKIDFYSKRKLAEKLAQLKLNKRSVTFDEIYSFIDIDECDKIELKRIEKDLEYKFCQKNNAMYSVYQICKELNKKIICVSNMYFSSEILSEILKINGYDIDEIYVSCEYNAIKQKGELFKILLNKKIINKKTLHIGDSFKADYLGAKYAGIKVYKIKTFYNNLTNFDDAEIKKDSFLTNNIIYSVINNNIDLESNYYEKLGYELLGPTIYNFCKWINKVSVDNGIDNLLFCARDTKLIQESYNTLFLDKVLPNSYLYISRKSTYLPYLYKNNNFEFFKNLIPLDRKNTKIVELFNLLNIEMSNYDFISEYGFDASKGYLVSDLFKNEKFELMFYDIISPYIEENGKLQYIYLKKYLDSLHLSENTAIIDLGWRGTTQKVLIDIMDFKIKGYYLALQKKHKEIDGLTYTYLFDGEDSKYSQGIYQLEELIELMFSALHGSTIKYTDDEKFPIIMNESANISNYSIKSIQKGAKDFINQISKYVEYCDDKIESDVFLNNIISIGLYPNYRQSINLGDIYSENYGIKYLARPDKLKKYIFSPKTYIRDLQNSSWKIGFLKRTFKIKFPYYKFYQYLKNVSKKKGR